MYKKTISYSDFDNNIVSKEFYFNLSKVELLNMEKNYPGGYGAMLRKIVDADDKNAMIDVVEQLVLDSYGVKSEDGMRFIKSQQLREEFEQTEAYSEFVYEILSDDKAATAFLQGIVPASLAAAVAEQQKSLEAGK